MKLEFREKLGVGEFAKYKQWCAVDGDGDVIWNSDNKERTEEWIKVKAVDFEIDQIFENQLDELVLSLSNQFDMTLLDVRTKLVEILRLYL